MQLNNDLAKLRLLYDDMLERYVDLELRIQKTLPKKLQRYFFAGASVGMIFGVVLGRLIAESR